MEQWNCGTVELWLECTGCDEEGLSRFDLVGLLVSSLHSNLHLACYDVAKMLLGATGLPGNGRHALDPLEALLYLGRRRDALVAVRAHSKVSDMLLTKFRKRLALYLVCDQK